MPKTRIIATGLACLLTLTLSACGGSTTPTAGTGGTSGTGGTGGTTTDSFADLLAAGELLFDEADGLGRDLPGDLPITGSATYAGYIGVEVVTQCNTDDCRAGLVVPPPFALAGKELIGELAITAEFGAGSLSGSIGNLLDNENNLYTAGGGGLPISGSINNSAAGDPGFDNVSANGAYTDKDSNIYNASFGLEGDFFGASGTAPPTFVAGGVNGGITTGGADEEAGEVGGFRNGAFIAKR